MDPWVVIVAALIALGTVVVLAGLATVASLPISAWRDAKKHPSAGAGANELR